MPRTADEVEISDVELVRRAQGGDPAAFAALVARYQHRVFNVCYRMCHNQADALDLTQSTFLKALENLRRFNARAAFYTWLFRIAVNLTISHRRAAGGHPIRSTNHGLPPPRLLSSADPGPGSAVEQRELRDRVEWALEQLDGEFRAAVVLKDIEGLDYASIAQILDVPIGTVKSRIHRGRLALRDLLKTERSLVDPAQTR